MPAVDTEAIASFARRSARMRDYTYAIQQAINRGVPPTLLAQIKRIHSSAESPFDKARRIAELLGDVGQPTAPATPTPAPGPAPSRALNPPHEDDSAIKAILSRYTEDAPTPAAPPTVNSTQTPTPTVTPTAEPTARPTPTAAPGTDTWTLAAPAGKTPEELNAIIDQLGTEAGAKDRLVGAGAQPVPDDVIEKMAKLARQRRAIQEIVARERSQIQGPPDPRRQQDVERIEPGARGGMQPTVDPVDMAAGGATAALRGAPAAAGRVALQTGAGEALASGATRLAGAAGLPPWLQSGIGILAGLAPLPPYGPRAPHGEPALVPDEVLPPEIPLPALPPRPGVRRPAFFTGQPNGRTIQQPYDPRFPALPEPGPRIPEERGLPAPSIAVDPGGRAGRIPERMEMPIKREFEGGLLRQPRPLPNDRGTQPGGEPKNLDTRWETHLPEDPKDQLRALLEAQAKLPETVKKGINPDAGRDARLAFGDVQRRATSSRPDFNPYTLPPDDFGRFRQMQQELRQFGAENLPSRGKLSRAEFAARLERQRQTDHDNAIKTFGPRSKQEPGQVEFRSRAYAADQINKGDRVITPQGPGTVIGNVEGAPTSQQIREKLDWEDPTFKRESQRRNPRFARARTTSVRIRLDDGREDAWSAWNIVRVPGEEKIAGRIPEVDDAMRKQAAKLKPRKSRQDAMDASERAYWKKRDAEDFGEGSASAGDSAEPDEEGSASFFDDDLPPPKR